MKKRTGVLTGIIASFIMASAGAQGNTMNVVNEGYLDITGEGAKANSVVTLEIVDASLDLSDYDAWKNYEDSGETTVFMGTVTADETGKYEFNIYMPKSGAYITRIGNEEFSELKVSELNFTNVTESREVLLNMKEAAEGNDVETLKNQIADNRYAIGLQSEVYEDADFDKTAEILSSYIKENADVITEENIGVICEKAMVISILDSKELKDIEKYGNDFGISGERIEEFYDSDFSKELTDYLKDENIKTIEDYDVALEEGIIFCLVNHNDSVDNLKTVLLEYADDLGISENKITTEKCRQLMKNGIDSIDEIEEILNKKSQSSPGGGGGGGSYGGKASSEKTPIVSMPIVETENSFVSENKETEIFLDLEGFDWAKESINSLYKQGIINGRGVKTFAPKENVLREEFVKMIVGSFKLSVIGEELKFTDYDKGAWYADFVKCAYHSKIVKGYSDEIFGIGDAITRQDVAVMVVNAAKACDYKFKDSGANIVFVDEDEIADYAKDAVKTLVSAGVISGDESGKFNPKGNATRAEAAKILYMTLCNTEK